MCFTGVSRGYNLCLGDDDHDDHDQAWFLGELPTKLVCAGSSRLVSLWMSPIGLSEASKLLTLGGTRHALCYQFAPFMMSLAMSARKGRREGRLSQMSMPNDTVRNQT